MIDRVTSPRNRSAIDLSAVIPWTNESGETIPAYGVVQLRTNFDGSSKASKPNAADGLFYASGMISVASTKAGESLTWDRPRPVLINGTVTVGDEVGPVSGQWYMDVTGGGFKVVRQPTGGVGVVVQTSSCKRLQVLMREDLFAAVDTKTDPSMATAFILRRKANGDLRRTTWMITVVNRFRNISVDKGTYAKAEWIDGEWQLYAADCPGGSESSSWSV